MASQSNVAVPCPAKPGALDKAGLKHSPLCGSPVHVHGERVRDGERRTIYACGYCSALFSLDADETEKVREQLKQMEAYNPSDGWYVKIGERLAANRQ